MTRVVAYQNKFQQFIRRVDYFVTPRAADLMQAIMEFCLPRKKAIRMMINDAAAGLVVGVFIGLTLGIVLLCL